MTDHFDPDPRPRLRAVTDDGPVDQMAESAGDAWDDVSAADSPVADSSAADWNRESSAGQLAVGEYSTAELLDALIDLVADTRAMPMSTTIKVNKEEILDLLEEARHQLPAELTQARRLLADRDAFVSQAHHDRDVIIDQGRAEVSRMVERQEIYKSAELRARQIVEQARVEAAQMRTQVEDYCDQKLASFESLLDKTSRTVQQGRQKLMGYDMDLRQPDPASSGPGQPNVQPQSPQTQREPSGR